MKILVFGAGAVGSALGGFLSPHHEVTLLGRKKLLDVIKRHGLHVSGIWGRHTFRSFSYATDLKDIKGQAFDLILITVKAYDTPAAVRSIRKIMKPHTVVVSLQNGLGNVEAITAQIPAKQVLAGRVIFGVEAPSPGKIKITVMAEPTAIGEAGLKRETVRVRWLAREFSKAGVPSVPCADVRKLLWAKVNYNCALNPLASLHECHYGMLMEKKITRLIMDEVVAEIYRVARAARISLKPETAEAYLKLFYSKLVPRTYDHHPSMLQHLQKGKRTEIDAMNGFIVRLGKKTGTKTPVNEMLVRLIKKAENSGSLVKS